MSNQCKQIIAGNSLELTEGAANSQANSRTATPSSQPAAVDGAVRCLQSGLLVLLLSLAAWTTSAIERAATWPQRVEADWLLAEQVSLLGGVSELVTTQADAAGGCDGIKNGEWGFHTDNSKDPWWQVDLGTVQRLARVVVWNRTATAARAARIKVLISDDGKEFRQVYQHDGTVFLGFKDNKPLVVRLSNESGRFVRVALPGTSWLDLDEVEVFGVSDPARNLALNQPADQISVSQWSVSHEKTKLVDWARRAEETLVVCERLAAEVAQVSKSADAAKTSDFNEPRSLTQASGFSLTRPAATLSRSERARGISRWERENRSQVLEKAETGDSSRDSRANRRGRKPFPLDELRSSGRESAPSSFRESQSRLTSAATVKGEGERNARATIANHKKKFAALSAGPEGSWPLRFDRLVQPVLDRQCVNGHHPAATNAIAAKFDLTPTKAHDTLFKFGKPSLHDQVWAAYRRGFSVTGDGFAQRSALWAMLEAPPGHRDVTLDTDARERGLIELRRASAGWLIERPSKETAAVKHK